MSSVKLRTISVIVFLGVFFGIIRSYLGDSITHTYPYSTFLFYPPERFSDLFNMILVCRENNPYLTTAPFASNYFPVANIFFFLLSLLSKKIIIALIFLAVFLTSYSALIYKFFLNRIKPFFLEFVIIFFFSYPLFFNVDRLNLEVYNFLLCLLWMYFRSSNKTFLSLLFLSLSISLKLYTGVYLVLYLKEKRYKEIFTVGALVVIMSVLSLFTFKGGFTNNIAGMLAGLKSFTEKYAGSSLGLQHNLSLYGMFKLITIIFIKLVTGKLIENPPIIQKLLGLYSIATLISFSIVTYTIIKKDLSGWMDYFLLTAILLLFPHVSFDYKLIFIYIPLISFLKESGSSGIDRMYSILFALLLIPHNYFYLYKDISVAVIIYPVILIAMSLFILLKPNPTLNASARRSHSFV